MVPPPASQARRDRSWEKRAREELGQVSYRGVPNAIRDSITGIAGELHVSTGEVARVLLEYAIRAYLDGEITMEPVLKKGKLTLFPDEV